MLYGGNMTYISWSPHMLVALEIHVGQKNLHAAGALTSQHVCFVLHAAPLLSKVVLSHRCFLRALSRVENTELSAQKVGVNLAQISVWAFSHGRVREDRVF